MPRDLFGDVVRPSHGVGSRKWYTVPLSLLAHLAVVVPILLVTIYAHDLLPIPPSSIVLIAAPEMPAPPPPPMRSEAKLPDRPVNSDAAPLEPPESITPEAGIEYADPVTVDVGVEHGVPGAATITEIAPSPPPPPPDPPKPVRPGGKIKPPERIRNVLPTYPPIAQAARVQGMVILEALIDTDGRVQDVRVLRSIQLLDQAAIDAVRQWRYTPTELNGVPVPVIMTVTVQFTLNQEE